MMQKHYWHVRSENFMDVVLATGPEDAAEGWLTQWDRGWRLLRTIRIPVKAWLSDEDESTAVELTVTLDPQVPNCCLGTEHDWQPTEVEDDGTVLIETCCQCQLERRTWNMGTKAEPVMGVEFRVALDHGTGL